MPKKGTSVGMPGPPGPPVQELDRGFTKIEQANLQKLYGFLFKPQTDYVKQCNYALELFKTDKEICYLCESYMPPHTNNPIKSDLFKPIPGNPTTHSSYPQCEHIIPCNSKSVKPYILMLMISQNYTSLFTGKNQKLKTLGIPAVITITQTNIDALIKDYSKDSISYFFNLIIRINYAWAHGLCNNTKTNIDFIVKDTSTGKYIISDNNLNNYLETFYVETHTKPLAKKSATKPLAKKSAIKSAIKSATITPATITPAITKWEQLIENFKELSLDPPTDTKITTKIINGSVTGRRITSNTSIRKKLEIILKVINDSKYETHIMNALTLAQPLLSGGNDKQYKKTLNKFKGGTYPSEDEINLIEVLIMLIHPDSSPQKGGGLSNNDLYLNTLKNEVSKLENYIKIKGSGISPKKRCNPIDRRIKEKINYIFEKKIKIEEEPVKLAILFYKNKITKSFSIDKLQLLKRLNAIIDIFNKNPEETHYDDDDDVDFDVDVDDDVECDIDLMNEDEEPMNEDEEFMIDNLIQEYKERYTNFIRYFIDQFEDIEILNSFTENKDPGFYFSCSVTIKTYETKFNDIIKSNTDFSRVQFKDVCRLAFTWFITGSYLSNPYIKHISTDDIELE
jgi:hypothetical protein